MAPGCGISGCRLCPARQLLADPECGQEPQQLGSLPAAGRRTMKLSNSTLFAVEAMLEGLTGIALIVAPLLVLGVRYPAVSSHTLSRRNGGVVGHGAWETKH